MTFKDKYQYDVRASGNLDFHQALIQRIVFIPPHLHPFLQDLLPPSIGERLSK